MTRADKVRGMTDVELAEWIRKNIRPPCDCCVAIRHTHSCRELDYCVDGILKYLQQEVDDATN